ncbi:hypothetical protein ACJ41O_001515 [Fusarium nematophilum]
MAMVPRRDSSLEHRPAGAGRESGNAISIMSASDFAVENNDQNRRLLAFLLADLRSGWHPSFKFLAAIIRNIAHTLIAVSSQELADMKVICCVDGNTSNQQGYTIRAVADQCRKLCGVALLETQNAMDIIDRESRELHATHGPLNRLLRDMVSGDVCEKAMIGHVQKATMAHELIVTQQTLSVRRWHELSRFVSGLRPALNAQLQILGSQKSRLRSRQTALLEELEGAETELHGLEQRESALRNDYQDAVDRHESGVRELRRVKIELQQLRDEIPLMEHVLYELKEDIELAETELQQDRFNEAKRREEMSKEAEGQTKGVTGMLWEYCWSGVAERQRRTQWDHDVERRTRALEEKKGDRTEQMGKIRKSKHELDRLKLRMAQLENRSIEADDALAQEGDQEAKIRKLQEEAQAKRPGIKSLKAELDEIECDMERIRKYEKVVPDLCRELGEMEGHAMFTYNGHKHTLRKLNDFSSKLASIGQRTATWNSKDARDIIEDTLGLRCHYIVIQFMSHACSFVCRELFADGFLTISHLGTQPSPQAGISPKDMHHEAVRRGIDHIYRQGERIASGFDSVKAGSQIGEIGEGRLADKFRENDCFLMLRRAINDVVESTPPRSLWLGTTSRLRHWTGRGRRQAVEEWATTVLGQEGRAEDIYELSGEQVGKVSELPGQEEGGRGKTG